MHKWFIYSLAPDALSTFFVQWFAKNVDRGPCAEVQARTFDEVQCVHELC